MTTIYLIRHAEAEGNLYRIVQGQYNTILTDYGWQQVRALERRFADEQIDAVYSSDLYRAMATASAVYLPKGLHLQQDPGLREIDTGVWECVSAGWAARNWPQERVDFRNHMDRFYVDGAERPIEVQDRMEKTIAKIAEENDGKTIVIVSHGYGIRLFLAKVQGYDLAEVQKTPRASNTAVSKLEYENGAFRLLTRDDSSHLDCMPELTAGMRFPKTSKVELWYRQAERRDEIPEMFWQEMEPELAARIRSRVGAADCWTLVACLAEEPVGLVQFAPARGILEAIFIRPEHRGQGMGVQCLGQAILPSRDAGNETLFARVAADSPAMPFFAICGFQAGKNEGELQKNIGLNALKER